MQTPIIDYFVRTTHKDVPFLFTLLRSVEVFLKLNGEFFIIFDDESALDHQAGSLMPKWAKVVFEPVPNITFTNVTGEGLHHKQKVQGIKQQQCILVSLLLFLFILCVV